MRIPWLERLRFLKTGAEAVAAAVRLARVATGRERVLGCGYHGWLDWSQGGEGIPATTRALYGEIPFNDVDGTRRLIREAGDRLAVVVVEPVVVIEPTREWLELLREETTRVGAVLVFDEIKTAFRLAIGGAAERYGVRPDLAGLGKAMADGFPPALGGGRGGPMGGRAPPRGSPPPAPAGATPAPAHAAAEIFAHEDVCGHLHRMGTRLLHGLHRLQRKHAELVTGVGGVA